MNQELYLDIVFTADILAGSPSIDGRRLAVGDIVTPLKWDQSVREVETYSELEKDKIRQGVKKKRKIIAFKSPCAGKYKKGS